MGIGDGVDGTLLARLRRSSMLIRSCIGAEMYWSLERGVGSQVL